MVDWSELPYDVLEYLTSFLSLPDYYRFSAVCQNWCLVARQKRHRPRQLPWLVLEEDDATHKRKLFSLEENRTYLIDIPELQGQRLVGSSYGWLLTLDIELNFRLLNPFTKKCYELPQLPPYSFEHNITTYVKGPESGPISFALMQKYLLIKAILDHDPSRNSTFKVLILYGQHNDLAFWKLGDPTWTLMRDACIWFTDIIFLKKDFYAVGNRGDYNNIYLLNTESHSPTAKRVGPRVKDRGAFAYLVDYMGELLMVQRRRKEFKRKFRITKKIFINKIDLENEKYTRCKPMEGYSLIQCLWVQPHHA